MDKELVIKLLKTNNVDLKDFNTFITEYVKLKLDKDLSIEELNGIVQAIQAGLLNLTFALLEAAKILDLNVLTIINKKGELARVEIYESF